MTVSVSGRIRTDNCTHILTVNFPDLFLNMHIVNWTIPISLKFVLALFVRREYHFSSAILGKSFIRSMPTVGHTRAGSGHGCTCSGTHLCCTSCGKPSFCIRSASSSNHFFSSSDIEFNIFFEAFVRSWNQPGVLVSAVSIPIIEAISLKTFSGWVHHNKSVSRNLDPGFPTGFLLTRQTFLNHFNSSWKYSNCIKAFVQSYFLLTLVFMVSSSSLRTFPRSAQ